MMNITGRRPPRYIEQVWRHRFEQKFMPEPNSGCWIWLGACKPTGYGNARWIGRQLMPATHIALLLAGRSIPEGEHVLHKCDNPYCVNPDHLFTGTRSDNTLDAMAKGRADLSGLVLGTNLRRKRK